MSKWTRYVRPEDYESEKRRISQDLMGDIIDVKAVDMNYAFVPMNKDDSSNLQKASECNLQRFCLEPKDNPSDY